MQRKRNKEYGGFVIVLSAGVSLLLSVLLAAIFGLIAMKGWIAEEQAAIVVGVIQASSAFVGAAIVNIRTEEKKLLYSLCSTGLYTLILTGITALMFDANYYRIGVSCALIFGSSITAWLVGCMSQHRSKKWSKYHTK